MNKALGMIEYKTVSTGMCAADLMVKTAEVQFIQLSVVCPGKYIALFSGELGAVKAAVDAVIRRYPEGILDCFVIGNPHKSLAGVLSEPKRPAKLEAIGIIETATAASAIQAGDTCVKAAVVRLIEIRIAHGMCGKSYVLLSGSVANVQEAVAVACANIADEALIDHAVIPRPDEKFWNMLVRIPE